MDGTISEKLEEMSDAIYSIGRTRTTIEIAAELKALAADVAELEVELNRRATAIQAAARAIQNAWKKQEPRVDPSLEDAVDRVLLGFINRTGLTVNHKAAGTREPVRARLKDGFTEDQCFKAIDYCKRKWLNDPDMVQYLHPTTIFRKSKFPKYLDGHDNQPLASSPYREFK